MLPFALAGLLAFALLALWPEREAAEPERPARGAGGRFGPCSIGCDWRC